MLNRSSYRIFNPIIFWCNYLLCNGKHWSPALESDMQGCRPLPSSLQKWSKMCLLHFYSRLVQYELQKIPREKKCLIFNFHRMFWNVCRSVLKQNRSKITFFIDKKSPRNLKRKSCWTIFFFIRFKTFRIFWDQNLNLDTSEGGLIRSLE